MIDIYPASPYNFIALEGQSNAYGIGPMDELPSDLSASFIQNGEILNLFTNVWENVVINVNNAGQYDSIATAHFGVEMRLLNLMCENYQMGCYLHKYTYTGTSLQQQGVGTLDWSQASTGKLFDLSNTSHTIAKLRLPQIPVPLKCLVWIQGENDAGDNTLAAPNYRVNLQNFIAAKRSFYNLPNLPFIIVRLGNLQTAVGGGIGGGGGFDTVRAAQNTVAAQANNYLVDADGLQTQSSDNTHYTSRSYDQLAIRIFNVIKTLP